MRRLRSDYDLASRIADEMELLAQRHEDEAKSATAKLTKQVARVEPLQQKHDGLKDGLREAEQQLAESHKAASMASGKLSALQGRFDAKCGELELATQNLHAAYKQREQAVATSMRQTAKFDRIIEVLDPSGTLAEELSGGGE
jgi:chromosome segregation ATPase